MIGRRSFLGATIGVLATAATGLWGLVSKQGSKDDLVDVDRRAHHHNYVETRDIQLQQLVLYNLVDGTPILTNWWMATFEDGKKVTFQGEDNAKPMMVVRDWNGMGFPMAFFDCDGLLHLEASHANV